MPGLSRCPHIATAIPDCTGPVLVRAVRVAAVQDAKLLLWGCSATLRRHDGLGLDTVFERIAFHRGLLDIMREGWSVPTAWPGSWKCLAPC